MQGILYEETSVMTFVVITLVMGGWSAWRTGKACADGWSPISTLVIYIALLGVGIRFIHHALFDGTFLSPHYYLVDTAILMIVGFAGYRHTRTRQMTERYYWLYRKTSPSSWDAK